MLQWINPLNSLSWYLKLTRVCLNRENSNWAQGGAELLALFYRERPKRRNRAQGSCQGQCDKCCETIRVMRLTGKCKRSTLGTDYPCNSHASRSETALLSLFCKLVKSERKFILAFMTQV